jgi:hypothetical protein
MNVVNGDAAIEIISKYIPAEFFPGWGKPVMAVVFLPQESITKLSSGMEGTIADNVRGLTLDLQAGEEIKTNEGRFIIYLSEGLLQNQEMLLFTLLHEFGHVNAYIYPKQAEKYADNLELYADMYAFEKLDPHLGLLEAARYLGTYASKHGFHAAMTDKENNA